MILKYYLKKLILYKFKRLKFICHEAGSFTKMYVQYLKIKKILCITPLIDCLSCVICIIHSHSNIRGKLKYRRGPGR